MLPTSPTPLTYSKCAIVLCWFEDCFVTIYSIDPLQKISHMPHRDDFEKWSSRLTNEQLRAIRTELQSMISSGKIHTAGWMPGSDWTGTVWQPIYEDACLCDEVHAGLCFGLFVWEAFQDHPDDWSFGRYKLGDVEIRSLTYFRIHPRE